MESSDTCEGEMWEHIKNGTRMMRDEEGSVKVGMRMKSNVRVVE